MLTFSVRIKYFTPKYPGWKSEVRYTIEARSWDRAEGIARVRFADNCVPGSSIWSVTSARLEA